MTYITIYYILQDISSNVIKYSKLRTKDGHIISSKWISKDKIKNRNNYSVAVSINYLNINYLNFVLLKNYINLFLYQINITIDKDAHRINAPRRLEIEEIYGEVEYFITHKYKELDHMFAYVHKIDKYEEDNYGQIYFSKFGSFQFIEIIGIDRCVGFFKIENLFYILDREKF